jgi:hypothetical protein
VEGGVKRREKANKGGGGDWMVGGSKKNGFFFEGCNALQAWVEADWQSILTINFSN